MTFAAPLGCATPLPAAVYRYQDARTVFSAPPPPGASSGVAKLKVDPARGKLARPGRGGRLGGGDHDGHSRRLDDRSRAERLRQARQSMATWRQ